MTEISDKEEAEEEVNESDVEEFSIISSIQFRECLESMKRYAMQKIQPDLYDYLRNVKDTFENSLFCNFQSEITSYLK